MRAIRPAATRAGRRALATLVVSALAVVTLAATPPASAADPVYPVIGDLTHQTGFVNSATTGILDLTAGTNGAEIDPPTPGSVTELAGTRGLQAAPILAADLGGSPLGEVTLASLKLDQLPISLPLSTLRLKGTQTWRDLLSGTALAGIPLVNVTWAQALSLTPVPAGIANLGVSDVDWSGSALRDVPLDAFTYGGTAVTDIDIPPLEGQPASDSPAQKWCKLLNSVEANSCSSPASLQGKTLIEIGVDGAPVADLPLRAIPLKSIQITASPLKSIPLKSIVLESAPLKSIPLKSIDLQASPLKSIPLKSIDLQASPLKSIPLKSIVLESAPLKSIPLKSIDLASSPLGSFQLGSLDWGTIALRDAPLSEFDLVGSAMSEIPIASLEDAASVAGCAATACDPAATLGSVAAANDLLPGATLSHVGASGFVAAGLSIADLVSALAGASTLDPQVGDLRLDLATDADSLLLGAILLHAQGAATDALVLGDLGSYTTADGHDITLGELGSWTLPGGDITLGDLVEHLDSSVSISDVLMGLVPARAFPYENFPFGSLRLASPGRSTVPPFDNGTPEPTPAMVGPTQPNQAWVPLTNPAAQDSVPVDVTITLPAGATLASVNGQVDVEQQVTADGRTQVALRGVVVPAGATPGGGSDIDVHWTAGGDLDVAQQLAVSVSDSATAAEQSSRTFDLAPVSDGQEPNTPQEYLRDYGIEPTQENPFPLDPDRRIPDMPINFGGCSAHDASCAGKDATYVDVLASGHISYAGDVDWFRIRDVRAGTRLTADLTNLPIDADLVLYGPSGAEVRASAIPPSDLGLPGLLIEDADLGVGQAARALANGTRSDLALDPGYANADGPVDPLTPMSVSQQQGAHPESVGIIAPVDGDYVVQVSGYHSARSGLPYTLRMRGVTPTSALGCSPRTFAHQFPAAGPPVAPDADVNTLFITAPTRMAATHGQAAADQVAAALQDTVDWMEANPDRGLVPGVVNVDSVAAVSAAYADWDAQPCSVPAANSVAAAITAVIDDYRTAGATIDHIAIVGGDDLVPMGRVPDLTRIANEAEYAATFDGGHNPVSAAAAGGFILSDDPYGDPSPTPVGNGNSLFVPQAAIGRLVESPADIAAQLASFTQADGELDTSTGLVSGYDFLSDGATATASRLAGDTGRTVDDSLIDAPGQTPGWSGEDLLEALFPAGAATPLVASVNAHYDHHALLTAKGDAMPDGSDVVTGDEIAAAAGAARLAGRVLFTMGCHAGLAVPDAYVAGTGAAGTSKDWAQTLAEANVAVYVANTGYGIGDSTSVAYSERLMALYAKLLDGSVTVGEALTYAKQSYYGSLGAVGVYDLKILQESTFYGLPFWDVSVPSPAPAPTRPELPGSLQSVDGSDLDALALTITPDLQRVDGEGGTYWTADDADPQVTHQRPTQPRTEIPVGTTGPFAHGALITSLVSRDVSGVTPAVSSPTVSDTDASPSVRSDSTTWPSSIAQITTSMAPYGRDQRLVITPGQFVGSTHDGTGVQRLYDEIGVEVLYAPEGSTDFDAPTVQDALAEAADGRVRFTVTATDTGGSVLRVVIGHQQVDGTWRFTDLSRGDGEDWTGSIDAAGGMTRYFIQVVDDSGNVGTSQGKTSGFAVTAPVVEPTPTPTPTPTTTATPTPTPTEQPPTPPGTADTTAPTITASVSPQPNDAGWIAGSSATVTFVCSDQDSGIPAGACPAPVVVSAQGSTPISGVVSDAAGNTSSTTIGVNLDAFAPTVTIAGNGKAARCVTTDGVSGVAAEAAGKVTAGTVRGLRQTTLTCGVATDRAGNTAPATTQTWIDRIKASRFGKGIASPPKINSVRRGKTVTFVVRLKQGSRRLTTKSAVRAVEFRKVRTQRPWARKAGTWRKARKAKGGAIKYVRKQRAYRFKWKAPRKRGLYEFRVVLADGSTRQARFRIR